MLVRHLWCVGIAVTPDFGPKPWISLGTVISRMEHGSVHLSWGYRVVINPIPVCVDSRRGPRPVSNPPVCTGVYSGRESGILASGRRADHTLHDLGWAGSQGGRAGYRPRGRRGVILGIRGPPGGIASARGCCPAHCDDRS